MPRVIRLLVRGKIDPIKTFFRIKTAGLGSSGPYPSCGSCQMKFAYYPGCSARSTCAELNEATHLVAAKLGPRAATAEFGDLHRRARTACHRSGRLLYAERPDPRAGRESRLAADDNLQHLHPECAGCPCRFRHRQGACSLHQCQAGRRGSALQRAHPHQPFSLGPA